MTGILDIHDWHTITGVGIRHWNDWHTRHWNPKFDWLAHLHWILNQKLERLRTRHWNPKLEWLRTRHLNPKLERLAYSTLESNIEMTGALALDPESETGRIAHSTLESETGMTGTRGTWIQDWNNWNPKLESQATCTPMESETAMTAR